VTTTGGGTVIIALCDTAEDTGTHAIQSYYLGSTVIQGSSAVAGITAGTLQYQPPVGYGFSSGTAFVIREAIKTTAPTVGYYLRKFNQTLGSNMWNATLIAPFTSHDDQSVYGPMSGIQLGADGLKYESSIGVWLGGDYRVGTMGTIDASLRVASVWLVNDASGSVYSAPFGSAGGTTSSYVVRARSICYVPGIGTALGTVHAFGQVDGQPRWCQYTVGSASITAVSTATGNEAMIAQDISASDILSSFYSSSATAVMLWNSASRSFNAVDRTLGTVLGVAPLESIGSFPQPTNGNDGKCDFKSGWAGGDYVSSILTYRGTQANATFFSAATAIAGSAGYVSLAGAGTATTMVWANSGGIVASNTIAGIASIAIGSASTGRMINFRKSAQPINVSASSGYWLSNSFNNATSAINRTDGLASAPALGAFILPAGATATVTFRSRAYNRSGPTFSNLTTDNPAFMGTAVTGGNNGTATWLTAGGTVSFTADVITLA
jgi:hypothetical protein